MCKTWYYYKTMRSECLTADPRLPTEIISMNPATEVSGESLGDLPMLGYAAIHLEDGSFSIKYGNNGHSGSLAEHQLRLGVSPELILSQVLQEADKNKIRLVAAGLIDGESPHTRALGAKLWLGRDVMPYIVPARPNLNGEQAELIAEEIKARFDEDGVAKIRFTDAKAVEVEDLVTAEEYREVSSSEDWERLTELAKQYKESGIKMIHINTSAKGGGVDIMNRGIIRAARALGIDIDWYALEELNDVFKVTKNIHNGLQNTDPNARLTEEGKKNYEEFIDYNFEKLKKPLSEATIIFIDDYQPSGLIPKVRELNPNAKIIFRSHTEIKASLADTPGTPQQEIWDYIYGNCKSADCFVFHPIKGFIPGNVPMEKTVLVPAATDSLNGLNKPLTEAQQDYYIGLFNSILVKNGQTPLDSTRPYGIQIARFDPAKGIDLVLESYAKLREKLKKEEKETPQLVICGNSAPDDPDGTKIYNQAMEIVNSEAYKDIAKDVKVAKLPHVDQMLNTLLRRSLFALQLSTAEGFEIKVTEALMKAIVVIAYKAGGIPLQIEDNVDGFLVEIGDTEEVARRMYQLLTDDDLRLKMSNAAIENYRRDVDTIPNLLRELYLTTELTRNGTVIGNGREI